MSLLIQTKQDVNQSLVNVATDPFTYAGSISAAGDFIKTMEAKPYQDAANYFKEMSTALTNGSDRLALQAAAPAKAAETFRSLATQLSADLTGLKAHLNTTASTFDARAAQLIDNALENLSQANRLSDLAVTNVLKAEDLIVLGKVGGALTNAFQLAYALNKEIGRAHV